MSGATVAADTLPGGSLCGGPRDWARGPPRSPAMSPLNAEGLPSARRRPFSGGEVHLLRKRWNIPTVKINGPEHNPHNGLTGRIPFKEPLQRSRFLRRPSSNGCREGGYWAASWRKECPGKLPFRACRSPSYEHKYGAPINRRKRHHEIFGSPIRECQRSTGICW